MKSIWFFITKPYFFSKKRDVLICIKHNTHSKLVGKSFDTSIFCRENDCPVKISDKNNQKLTIFGGWISLTHKTSYSYPYMGVLLIFCNQIVSFDIIENGQLHDIKARFLGLRSFRMFICNRADLTFLYKKISFNVTRLPGYFYPKTSLTIDNNNNII